MANKTPKSNATKVIVQQPAQVLTFIPPKALNKTGSYKMIKGSLMIDQK